MDSKYSVLEKGAYSSVSFGLKRKFSYGSGATPNGHPNKRPNLQIPPKNGPPSGTNGTTNGKHAANAFKIQQQRKILPVYGVRTE